MVMAVRLLAKQRLGKELPKVLPPLPDKFVPALAMQSPDLEVRELSRELDRLQATTAEGWRRLEEYDKRSRYKERTERINTINDDMPTQPVTDTVPSFSHNGYRINDMGQGFRPSQLDHGLVSSYVITKDGQGYGFAFHVNLIATALHNVQFSHTTATELAQQIITARLDSGNLTDRAEYTYDYDLEGTALQFREVSNPPWWISSDSS
jgi:hypothetical protein